jgi:hypothetical protein
VIHENKLARLSIGDVYDFSNFYKIFASASLSLRKLKLDLRYSNALGTLEQNFSQLVNLQSLSVTYLSSGKWVRLI